MMESRWDWRDGLRRTKLFHLFDDEHFHQLAAGRAAFWSAVAERERRHRFRADEAR
jgi:hypothetical protein